MPRRNRARRGVRGCRCRTPGTARLRRASLEFGARECRILNAPSCKHRQPRRCQKGKVGFGPILNPPGLIERVSTLPSTESCLVR